MIIQMMGPQACGKGTQGELLSKELNLPIISVGQLLRDIPESHPRYQEVQGQLNSGVLVSYDLTVQIINERLSEKDCKNGYILDGWGRNIDQFEFFDPHPNWVILINIPREESLKRISGRRYCESDGKMYNIYTLPKEELAKCEGPLVQREDDTEEAVNERLEIYYRDTQKVIDKYRNEKILLEINGLGTPQQVFARVLSALELAQKISVE